MPRTREQNEQIRAATRAAVVDTAMKLFAQNGYSHTTTRAIAREAGLSTGLMYHYFDSKERLLRAVFEQTIGVIDQAIRDAYTTSEALERLAGVLRAMFDLLAVNPAAWSLFIMMRAQPAIQRELGDDFLLWTQRLRDLFESELHLAGRADPVLDALLLYSLVDGAIQQYLLDPDNYPLDAVTGAMIGRYAGPQ